MKKSLIAAILLMASVGQAKTIVCDFTEPFVVSSVSSDSNVIAYRILGVDVGDTSRKAVEVIEGAELKQVQSTPVEVYEVVAGGKVIQTLSKTGKGNNGMSDRMYSYEVKDNSGLTGLGFGGCEEKN